MMMMMITWLLLFVLIFQQTPKCEAYSLLERYNSKMQSSCCIGQSRTGGFGVGESHACRWNLPYSSSPSSSSLLLKGQYFSEKQMTRVVLYQSSKNNHETIDSDDDDDDMTAGKKVDNSIDFDSLMDMDVILFQRRRRQNEMMNDILEVGAIQEDGTLAPLSAWSLESSPTGGSSLSIEFLVDEEDRFPGLTSNDIWIHSVVKDTDVSYGSRQVGGGKGPGNPHGEESELLYYIERNILETNNVQIVIKPELEILW